MACILSLTRQRGYFFFFCLFPFWVKRQDGRVKMKNANAMPYPKEKEHPPTNTHEMQGEPICKHKYKSI